MLPAGKENSGSGSVDLAVYWLTVQKFAGVTPEGTLNVWNQRFWCLCTSSIETAERRSMQFSLSGVARGIVFEHWILYGSSRDIGPSRAFNWHWGGVITSISEVCIAMSRKRWTTWPRLLFTTNIGCRVVLMGYQLYNTIEWFHVQYKSLWVASLVYHTERIRGAFCDDALYKLTFTLHHTETKT